jgi:hypothetical protein
LKFFTLSPPAPNTHGKARGSPQSLFRRDISVDSLAQPPQIHIFGFAVDDIAEAVFQAPVLEKLIGITVSLILI